MTSTSNPDLDRLDMERVEQFLGRAVTDAGAAVSVLLTHLGDRLGLYEILSDGTAVTCDELADRSGANPRMLREWLSNQAVSGYLEHDPTTERFRLPAEHAAVLAQESSPALAQGLMDLVVAVYQSVDKETDAILSGTGLTWKDHHPSLFDATERAFRPGYQAHLVQEWIPAVEGLSDLLEAGADVLDVGCGHAAATLTMASSYPRSRFRGIDYHEPSLDAARAEAAQLGLTDNVTFELGDASQLEGEYDLITFFDSWHDTRDPAGAARAAKTALNHGGCVLAVEPFAGVALEDNATPLGRFGYGISTLVCTPCSVSDGGPGLGAQAGPQVTEAVFREAGFDTVNIVAESPINLVYEIRE